MKAIPMWYEPSVTHYDPAMPNLELRVSITVLLNLFNKSNTRDGWQGWRTCIDAASPSHAITMGPMKAIPMWYEPSATHLGPNMPNLELSVSMTPVLLNLPNLNKTKNDWQGWHLY
jgi:hypothetical protein